MFNLNNKKLDIESASVLRTVLEMPIYMASAMIAIIFDTEASMSISGGLNDSPHGIEECSTTLQEIGSGLWVTGKGIVCWIFQSWEVDLLQLNVWCITSLE